MRGRPRPARGVGRQPGGASSKPSNRKPGATVQPTSVQAPRLVAVCHQPAGTTNCGRSPRARSGPRRCGRGVVPVRRHRERRAARPHRNARSRRRRPGAIPTRRRRRGGSRSPSRPRVPRRPGARPGTSRGRSPPPDGARGRAGGRPRRRRVGGMHQNRFFHSRSAWNTSSGGAPSRLTARASAGSPARRNGFVAFSAPSRGRHQEAALRLGALGLGGARLQGRVLRIGREREAGVREHVIVPGIHVGLVRQRREALQRMPEIRIASPPAPARSRA